MLPQAARSCAAAALRVSEAVPKARTYTAECVKLGKFAKRLVPLLEELARRTPTGVPSEGPAAIALKVHACTWSSWGKLCNCWSCALHVITNLSASLMRRRAWSSLCRLHMICCALHVGATYMQPVHANRAGALGAQPTQQGTHFLLALCEAGITCV